MLGKEVKMPIYEYICLKCSNDFSVLQSMSSSEKDTTCSKCGSNNVKKKVSVFSANVAGDSLASPSSCPAGGGGGGG